MSTSSINKTDTDVQEVSSSTDTVQGSTDNVKYETRASEYKKKQRDLEEKYNEEKKRELEEKYLLQLGDAREVVVRMEPIPQLVCEVLVDNNFVFWNPEQELNEANCRHIKNCTRLVYNR